MKERDPIRLDYRTPPDSSGEPDRLAIQLSFVFSFIRQLAFAVGLGLMAFGTGYSIRENGDGAFIMGWGGFILGLAIPLRRRESEA